MKKRGGGARPAKKEQPTWDDMKKKAHGSLRPVMPRPAGIQCPDCGALNCYVHAAKRGKEAP